MQWWGEFVKFVTEQNPFLSGIAALLTIVVILGGWLLWPIKRRQKETRESTFSAGRDMIFGDQHKTKKTTFKDGRKE